jgi:hypothetical protein
MRIMSLAMFCALPAQNCAPTDGSAAAQAVRCARGLQAPWAGQGRQGARGLGSAQMGQAEGVAAAGGMRGRRTEGFTVVDGVEHECG